MSRKLKIITEGTSTEANVDYFPDYCGLCHSNVDPIYIGGVMVKGDYTSDTMEAAFQCTNSKCTSIIIGYYRRSSYPGLFKIIKSAPTIPENKNFVDEIGTISDNFVTIYNQAFFAEQTGLTLISGIGYRKSLEFLIKDYLIEMDKDNEEKILNMPLGQCIDKLENSRIKEIAKRATWLGNDEAHYKRKWADKDVNDLKILIDITVHFIAMDISSKRYLEEMPK